MKTAVLFISLAIATPSFATSGEHVRIEQTDAEVESVDLDTVEKTAKDLDGFQESFKTPLKERSKVEMVRWAKATAVATILAVTLLIGGKYANKAGFTRLSYGLIYLPTRLLGVLKLQPGNFRSAILKSAIAVPAAMAGLLVGKEGLRFVLKGAQWTFVKVAGAAYWVADLPEVGGELAFDKGRKLGESAYSKSAELAGTAYSRVKEVNVKEFGGNAYNKVKEVGGNAYNDVSERLEKRRNAIEERRRAKARKSVES